MNWQNYKVVKITPESKSPSPSLCTSFVSILLFLISEPPSAHSSLQFRRQQHFCFSVAATHSVIYFFSFLVSLVCSYYLPNHYQSFLYLLLNRRFINRQAVITVCAFVAKVDKAALVTSQVLLQIGFEELLSGILRV